jgi:hypothetical protein
LEVAEQVLGQQLVVTVEEVPIPQIIIILALQILAVAEPQLPLQTLIQVVQEL